VDRWGRGRVQLVGNTYCSTWSAACWVMVPSRPWVFSEIAKRRLAQWRLKSAQVFYVVQLVSTAASLNDTGRSTV
jgi:hypothetical protein